MPKMKLALAGTMLLIWVLPSKASALDALYVGVLENFPQHESLWNIPPEKRPKNEPGHTFNYVVPADASVRVCFQKAGNNWVVANDPPAKISWTVTFDGKKVGAVTTQRKGKPEGSTIPTVGRPSMEFSFVHNAPSYRPLVAVSQPYFSDPEAWRRTELSPPQKKAVFTGFRTRNSAVRNCTSPMDSKPKPWEFLDSDLKVERTYASSKNWVLAEVRLEGCRCDYCGDSAAFDAQWYTIAPDHEVAFLSSGLRLVDAGDYDNDGKSEIVFKVERGEATGGYEIYYDDFHKHAVLEFPYH